MNQYFSYRKLHTLQLLLYCQVSALRSAHQNEVQSLLMEHAVYNSGSRVAELTGKVDTQEVGNTKADQVHKIFLK